MAEHLGDQALSSGGSTLVRNHIRVWPLGEIVHGHKDVAILLAVGGKGAQDVHAPTSAVCEHRVGPL